MCTIVIEVCSYNKHNILCLNSFCKTRTIQSTGVGALEQHHQSEFLWKKTHKLKQYLNISTYIHNILLFF
jgi:hypothetical protein